VRLWLVAMGLTLLLVPATAVGASPSGAPHTAIQVHQTRWGPVLADGNGMTLYVYVDDLLTNASTACTGDCENDWPPALVSGPLSRTRGITGHVGTIARRGGLRQLTIDGRPLYTFAGDRAPGDLRGNGIGNIWWAMTPSGLSATSFPNLKSTYGTAASTLLTVTHTTLGPAVATARGQVLYAYTDDTASHSACTLPWCLVDWPPLQASATPTAPSTITAPIAVIAGAGETQQVTLAGHPLYTFAGDLHPSDIRGQGIGGDWLMISPTGSLIGARPAGVDASPSPESPSVFFSSKSSHARE
jgi:predicted lipoprotein with Yx(FWY)xxD motif